MQSFNQSRFYALCGVALIKKGYLMSSDKVNHPSHYKTGKYECIDVMIEVFGIEKVKAFCELNSFKYLWRSGHKGAEKEDIEKAACYLDYFKKLEMMKNEELEN